MPTPDLYPDRGTIRFRQSRDVGSTINASFAFVRQNLRELLVGYLALVVPAALGAGVALVLFVLSLGSLAFDPAALEADPSVAFGAGYLGFAAFALLASAVSQAAVAAYVRLYRMGEAGTITVGVLWDEARGFILPLMGMALLYGLVTGLAQFLSVFPRVGGLLYIGFVIWSYPYYMMATVARTIDAPSVGEAWSRATVLVKGEWWYVFGTYLLTWIIVFGLMLALMIAVSVVMGVVMASIPVGSTQMVLGVALTFVPLMLVGVTLYLIPVLAGYVAYGRLTDDLEGTTLYEDLDTLAGEFDDRPAPSGARVPWPLAPEPDASTDPDDVRDASDAPAGDDRPSGSDAPGGFRGGGFGGA